MNQQELKDYLKYGEPPVPEYKIVFGTYMDELVAVVNYWIKEGWEPLGGVNSAGVTSILWTQAMIKR